MNVNASSSYNFTWHSFMWIARLINLANSHCLSQAEKVRWRISKGQCRGQRCASGMVKQLWLSFSVKMLICLWGCNFYSLYSLGIILNSEFCTLAKLIFTNIHKHILDPIRHLWWRSFLQKLSKFEPVSPRILLAFHNI